MKFAKLSKSFLCLLVVLLIPGMVLAATGKIRGTVKDVETGEPLMGANVVVQGTVMGAATDMKGEYIILNVPAGKYSVVATYMGYQKMTIQEIIVTSGLTTFQDFAMSRIVIEGQEVVIVAERPLVDKSATHEIHSMRAEEIEYLPIRTTAAAVALLPGIVTEGTNVYVRGGRSTEMAYYVEGINVTMPDNGSMGLSVIQNSVEELTYHAGGFGAEFGTRMSGQVFTTLKTGGKSYNFGGEVISDDFWAVERNDGAKEILGIKNQYSYGYDDYILWGSGPVPSVPSVRFYLAGQRYWRQGDGNPLWFQGFSESDSVEATGKWTTEGKDAGTKITDTLGLAISFPPGRYPGGGTAGSTFNGNLIWDVQPFRVKIGGTFNKQQDQAGFVDLTVGFPDPRNFLVLDRAYLFKRRNYSAYLGVTHTIDPTAFYTLNLSYFYNHFEQGDPLMGWGPEDWPKWGDPTINPALADTSLLRVLHGPGNFDISYPGTPARFYNRQETNMIGAKLDFTKQFGKIHEVKLGGELNYYTIRRYQIEALQYLRQLAVAASVEGTPKEMTEWDFYRGLNTTFTGYDMTGENKVSEDELYAANVAGEEVMVNAHNAPGHPIFAGVYIQDGIELKDFIVNAGIRLDYIDNGVPGYKDITRLTMGPSQTIADSNFTDSKKFTYVSPRLGFSFPVTDRIIFHAQYGKYIQSPRVDMRGSGINYLGYMRMTQFIYGGGYAVQVPNPNLKPERTTSYEFGFKESFGDVASLDVTAFYKDTRDLIAMRVVFPNVTDYRAPYFNVNEDFGTIKGLSFTFNLRRVQHIQVAANYTYSQARGTGSDSRSHFDICWTEETPIFPVVIAALDYDQRHKGWVDFDVRFGQNEGPEIFGLKPLSGTGLNLSFNFHSGSPYTRIEAKYGSEGVFGIQHPPPLEAYNASTLDWSYQLDGKLEKSFRVGPLDMSAYLWVINVLNTKGFTNGYRATGRPDDDGWLASEPGKAWAEEYGPTGVKWFKAIMTQCGTQFWQTPRIIRAGLKFEL